MQSLIIGMLAETFVHSGTGQSLGAIDLPVARERTTDYPYISGSGVKGGLKAWAEERAGLGEKVEALFGRADNAGQILVSDARLLLLPVRSLNSAYIWLTCPLLLERLERDIQRAGGSAAFLPANGIPVAAGVHLSANGHAALALEEREFARAGPVPNEIITAIQTLLPQSVRQRVPNQLAIVGNDDFAWFAKYALPVAARNALSENKTSDNLWYEETLPPDTVMYCLIAGRAGPDIAVQSIATATEAHRYCQFGGNETLGQGWFQMTVTRYSAPGAANV